MSESKRGKGGGNAHVRAMARAAEEQEPLPSESKSPEAPSVQSQESPKERGPSAVERFFIISENVWILTAISVIAGLAGLFVDGRWFVLFCIPTAFGVHRSKGLRGLGPRPQCGIYALIIAVSAGTCWWVGTGVNKSREHIPTVKEIGDYILSVLHPSPVNTLPLHGYATLRELFENGWPNLPAYYDKTTIEFTKPEPPHRVVVFWRLNGDFIARSKFFDLYFEEATPPNYVVDACKAIANDYEKLIDIANHHVDISGRAPDDTSPTHMRDMVFSKRFFLYYDAQEFSIPQKNAIEEWFQAKGLSIQFRDQTYAFLHRDDHAFRKDQLVPNSILLPDVAAKPGLVIFAEKLDK